MKKNLFFSLATVLVLAISIGAQGGMGSEDELKTKANELFVAQNFKEAKLMYAQLLSLYPKDPTYNYRFGACVLQTEANKSKPMKYLYFAASKANVDPLAYFYLGKAHHLNYEFAKAVKQYSRFKNKADNEDKVKYNVDRQIEMCKNGNSLLTKINEVQVIERQSISVKDFYRIYDEKAIGGKIIVQPEEFRSRYDKKIDAKSIIFLANDANEVYYSSYGKKGDNGKDIYKAIKLGNGEWSEGVSLGSSINTSFDEDYAYMKPDGTTLYFASKGHSSMGGYDIFRSVLDNATMKWTEPENLDFAFNSADDDFMFITDPAEITAYFTSNRSNEFGEVTVYKVLTDRAPAELSVISGSFVAESNLGQKKAKITVIDKETQQTIGVYETDDNGNYAIEIAKNGGEYQFNIETNETDPIHTGVVIIPSQDQFEVLGQELRLVGSGNEQQLVIKNIFDGTAVNSNSSGGGPSVSSELIKMKADLEVNYNLNDLAELERKRGDLLANKKEEEEQKSEEIEVKSDEELLGNEVVDGEEISRVREPVIEETESQEKSKGAAVIAIENELERIKSSSNQLIDDKQSAISAQYISALKLNTAASDLFEEANKLEDSGAKSVDVDMKRKQAGEKALKATVAVGLALDLEESINLDLNALGDMAVTEANIRAAIEENDIETASSLMNGINSQNEKAVGVSEIFSSALGNIEKNNSISDKKIKDFSAKSQSFKDQKNSLEIQLTDLNYQFEKAGGKRKDELEKSIEATQLDLDDLEYQSVILDKTLLESQLSKKSSVLEKEEVMAASNRLNAGLGETSPLSEENKNMLLGQLKKYREENLLAFSAENKLYQNIDNIETIEQTAKVVPSAERDFDSNVDSKKGMSDGSVLEKNTVNFDNSSTNNVSTDNSSTDNTSTDNNSSDIISPDNTSTDNIFLDNTSADNTFINNTSSDNVTTNSINTQYSREMEGADIVEDVELRLAKKISVYDQWLNALMAKKESMNVAYEVEVDQNERSFMKTELDLLANKISENQKSKKNLESELAQRASGKFAEASPISNSNEITEMSVVNTEFTSLEFDQQLQPSNPQTAVQLIEAKKALYEAGQLSKQQKMAQESAYTLPTAAERMQAFSKANELKKESEAKQLEAAGKFAAFNLKEYQLNKLKIQEANQLDERFSTDGRDIAILLEEEASSFFTDAAILRSEVNASNRLSQKEVNLQKAYDYELLAIKKQQEALRKLGMVISEVVSNKTSVNASKPTKPFIQIIENSDVLTVVEAPIALKKAEAKRAEVITIENKIEVAKASANGIENGEAKDSALAVVEQLRVERGQVLKLAALYYERERQIKAGLVGVASEEKSPKQIILPVSNPAFVVVLDPVDIDSDREKLVLGFQNFKEFANNRQELLVQTKLAQVAYEEAIRLAEENQRLNKQAIIETNMVRAVNGEGEKQRLIKSALVIEKKIKTNEERIISLNKTIKVKNFLLKSLAEKDAVFLTSLSEAEKKEFIVLSKDYVPEIKPAESVVEIPNTLVSVEKTNDQVESDETAQSAEELEILKTETNTLDLSESVAIVEEKDVVLQESLEVNDAEAPLEVANSKQDQFIVPNEKEEVEEFIEAAEPIIPAVAAIKLPVIKELPVGIKNIDLVPREVKQAIFVTLNRNESAYNDNRPIPTKTILPEGVVYKVQIGAFRNKIPANTFKGFAPLMAEVAGSGITRYTAGLFANEKTATAARNEIRNIGYPDAFVVAFLNGERISNSAARRETGEAASSNSATANFQNISTKTGTSASTSSVIPSSAEVTQVQGGSKEALPVDFNSDKVEEVVNAKTIEGLYYTIQIGVFSAPVKKGVFKYERLNIVQLSSGLYRYNTGIFESVLAAADLKNTISNTIKDAFVTAYYNGERVSLTKASKLKNK